jgi:hypothetical protein
MLAIVVDDGDVGNDRQSSEKKSDPSEINVHKLISQSAIIINNYLIS